VTISLHIHNITANKNKNVIQIEIFQINWYIITDKNGITNKKVLFANKNDT